MSDRLDIVLIVFVVALVVLYQLRKRTSKEAEHFTDAEKSEIRDAVKEVYDVDVAAIKNLSDIAAKLYTTNNLTVPASLGVTNEVLMKNKKPVRWEQGDPGPMIEVNYGGNNNRYGVGQWGDGTLRMYTAKFGNWDGPSVNLSLAKEDGGFDDILKVRKAGTQPHVDVNGIINAKQAVNVDGTLNAKQAVNVDGELLMKDSINMNVAKPIKYTVGDPGPIIEVNYGAAGGEHRYGFGQWPNGTVRTFAGNYDPGSINMSFAKADGSFKDVLTAKNDGSVNVAGNIKAANFGPVPEDPEGIVYKVGGMYITPKGIAHGIKDVTDTNLDGSNVTFRFYITNISTRGYRPSYGICWFHPMNVDYATAKALMNQPAIVLMNTQTSVQHRVLPNKIWSTDDVEGWIERYSLDLIRWHITIEDKHFQLPFNFDGKLGSYDWGRQADEDFIDDIGIRYKWLSLRGEDRGHATSYYSGDEMPRNPGESRIRYLQTFPDKVGADRVNDWVVYLNHHV